MRIVCPNCSAAYDVPDSRISPSRVVRCAKCVHEWTPLPVLAPAQAAAEAPVRTAGPASAPAPGSAPAPDSDSTPAAPAAELRVPPRALPPRDYVEDEEPDQNRRSGAWGGWLVTLIVLAALCWAAYGWRDQIMQAWPPSIRLYAALGLAPPVPQPSSPAPPQAPPAPALPPGQSSQPSQPPPAH
jgi:predicted Zn finger-like uncharacterized protein